MRWAASGLGDAAGCKTGYLTLGADLGQELMGLTQTQVKEPAWMVGVHRHFGTLAELRQAWALRVRNPRAAVRVWVR